MPTIATSGGDYSSVTSWEAAIDDMSGQGHQEGIIQDAGPFDEAETVAFNATNCDSSNYRELTTTSGAKYDPVAGSGAVVECDEAFDWVLDITEAYFKVNNVKLSGDGATTRGALRILDHAADGFEIDAIYCDAPTTSQNRDLVAIGYADDGLVTNIIVVGTSSGTGSAFGIECDRNHSILNCTVYDMGGTGIEGQHASCTVKNCIAIDNGTDFSFDASATHDYNISSDSTATGSNSHTNETAANIFNNAGSDDFRPKASSNADGGGDDLSGTFTTDFDGDAHGAGSTAWNIGSYEETVSASGTDHTVNAYETVTIGEAQSVSSVATHERSAYETVTVGEGSANVVDSQRTSEDSVSVGEARSRVAELHLSENESVTISEDGEADHVTDEDVSANETITIGESQLVVFPVPEYFEKTQSQPALDMMGIVVTSTDLDASDNPITQKVWAPGTVTQEFPGGWVTPGKYEISIDVSNLHHPETGVAGYGATQSGYEINIVQTSRALEDDGWISHNNTDDVSMIPVASGTDPVTVTLAAGDTLHVAYGDTNFSDSGQRDGSDGIIVWCVAQEPLPRGGLWGTGYVPYDETAWADFLSNDETASIAQYEQGTSNFFISDLSAHPDPYPDDWQQEVGATDNEQLETIGAWAGNIASIIYREGINYFTSAEQDTIERMLHFGLSNVQSTFLFSDAAGQHYTQAHGNTRYPPYEVRAKFGLIRLAGALGKTPAYEPLYMVMMGLAQRMDMTCTHEGQYNYGNTGTPPSPGYDPVGEEDEYTDWIRYTLGMDLMASEGVTNFAKGQHRFVVWGPAYVMRKIFDLSETEAESDMINFSGWGPEEDRHGHVWNENGLGGGWNGGYNSRDVAGMMLLWVMQPELHTKQVMRYARRNIQWINAWDNENPDDYDTDPIHADRWWIYDYAIAHFVGEPRNPDAYVVNDADAYITWDAVTDADHYQLFRGTESGNLSLFQDNIVATNYTVVASDATDYIYAVRAVRAFDSSTDDYGSLSDEVEATGPSLFDSQTVTISEDQEVTVNDATTREANETVTIGEAQFVETTGTSEHAAYETVTIGESTEIVATYVRTTAEGVTVSEAQEVSETSAAVTENETVTIGEDQSIVLTHVRVEFESVTIGETNSQGNDHSVEAFEVVTIGESVGRASSYSRSASETLTISALDSRSAVTVNESVTISEGQTATHTIGGLEPVSIVGTPRTISLKGIQR